MIYKFFLLSTLHTNCFCLQSNQINHSYFVVIFQPNKIPSILQHKQITKFGNSTVWLLDYNGGKSIFIRWFVFSSLLKLALVFISRLCDFILTKFLSLLLLIIKLCGFSWIMKSSDTVSRSQWRFQGIKNILVHD